MSISLRPGIAGVLLTALAAGCFPAPAQATGPPAPAPPVTENAGPIALLVEPDDGPEPVLSFIRDAQRSLDVEMYLLTDEDAIQALIDMRLAGRDVRVILEPHPFGADGANQPAHDRLVAVGATVSWASPRFALTHAKLILADQKRALVMCLNLTHAGLNTNREYAALDQDATDVADLAAIFAADLIGVPAPAPRPTPSPSSSWPGRVLASPVNARGAIADLIAGARGTIAVEIEELSDAASVDALAASAARGVAVTVVVPGADRAASTDQAVRSLAAGGVSVRGLESPTVHAKAMVVDGRRLYLGSVNLTAASLDANRELGLRLDDATMAARVARTIAADWARGGEL